MFSLLALFPLAIVVSGFALKFYLNSISKSIYHLQTGVPIESPSLSRMFWLMSVIIGRKKSLKDISLELFEKGQPMIEADYFPVIGYKLNVYHPDDIKKVLSSSDFEKEEMKATTVGHFGAIMGESLVAVGGKNGWQQRKALNPAFTYGRIKTLTPTFVNLTNKFLDLLDKSGDCVNIYEWFKNLTFDALGLTMFGYDFKSLANEVIVQKSNLNTTFSNAFRPIDVATFGLYYQLPLSENKRIKSAANASKKLIIDVINKRTENRNKDINDLLDLILEGSDSDVNLTEKQIVHNLFFFFLAGHDTLTTTLTAAIYFLGKYPEYQDELFNEVISILGKDGVPNAENVGNFKFINCIMKETLRLIPPVMQIGTRVATKNTELHGYFIPKGTTVQASLTHAHFSELFWTDAKKFNPHRFFKDQTVDAKKIWSFAAGPRICIGHKFATVEMTVVLAMMSRKYKWRVNTEWVDEPISLTTSPKGGLPIILEKRELIL